MDGPTRIVPVKRGDIVTITTYEHGNPRPVAEKDLTVREAIRLALRILNAALTEDVSQ